MRRFLRRAHTIEARPSRSAALYAMVAGALLLALALSACSITLPDVGATQGSGTQKTETRAVSGFTGLTLSGIGTVKIRQTGTESLTVTTDDNILPLLTSSMSGDILVLGVKSGTIPRPTNGITWNLTVKNLTAITLSGAGNINAQDITPSSLTARVSGAGNLSVSGKATSQIVILSGAGSYNARGFPTTSATVTISGAGSATVNVSGTLDATVSGAGSVTYYGAPQVTKHITGVGSVKPGT